MHKHFIDVWLINRPLAYLYILLFVGAFILLGTDQALDFYVSFLDAYELDRSSLLLAVTANKFYFVKFSVALTIWAMSLWYSARLTLQFSNLEVVKRTKLNLFQLFAIPRIMGMLPFLIPVYGFLSVDAHHLALPLILITLAILCFIFFDYRERAWQRNGIKLAFARISWSQFPFETNIIYYIVWTIGLLLLILFSLPASFNIAEWFRPATIIVSTLFSFTIWVTVLNYKDFRTPLPLFLIVLLAVFVFTFFNNNHDIRVVSQQGDLPAKAEFSTYFKDWVSSKVDSVNSNDSIPLYIIAAEGGGIRSLNWTALVLENLRRKNKEFYDHIFAISGVSGGSVGALFHVLYAKDYPAPTDSLYTNYKSAVADDFLSPLTAAFLYPDLIQRFLPIKINYFDRAKWLEDSWSESYKTHLFMDSFDKPFLSLWQNGNRQTPCLFINGTLSETGQKTILSNIRLSPKYFHDVVDIHSIMHKDVPIKTAALLSARFPIITPGGVVRDSTDRLFGQVVDGGYVENTALGTAVQVLNQVLDLIDTNNVQTTLSISIRRRIKPIVIFIKNGATSEGKPDIQRFSYETLVPLNAFLNSWGRGGETTTSSVKQITDRLKPKVGFIKIELDRRVSNRQGQVISLPLGWFMSETAKKEITRQAELLEFK